MLNKELLFTVKKDDFQWDTFRCGGKGGQNVNKRETGVRCTHAPSGAVGKSCDQRSQYQNRSLAWDRCVKSPAFRAWIRKRVVEIANSTESPEEAVERLLATSEIKVENFVDGKWVDSENSDQP